MYDGDTPLAERRAGALTLDRDLLRELLGQEELRELLDPDALADLELTLQALTDDRRATTLDGVHDLLRRLGDLSADEVAARTEGGAAAAGPWLEELAKARRAVRTRIAGDDRWLAIEDVARYRDGVGIAPPVGIPAAFLGPATGALDGLLARYARTHGPFLTPDPARRWGLPVGVVGDALERMLAAGTLLRGEFRPGGAEREWCDPEVLRLLRRRSLARLRREVEPVDPAALGRFLPDWQGVAPVGAARPPLRGTAALERLAEVVDQLAGLPIPASVLERDVLPARIPGYQPRLLDELGALGEVAWVGRGSLGRDDGRIALVRPGREILRPIGPPDGVEPPAEPRHVAIREHLAARGRLVLPRAVRRRPRRRSDREVLDALWDLVWAGEVTNDTFAPLRALRWKRTGSGARRAGGRPGRLTALGPAGGGRSLVAGRRTGGRPASPGTPPRPEPRPARAPRRPDPRGRRDRGHRGRVRGRLPGPARDGGRRADPARLLRRRPGCGPVRAGRGARPAAVRARAGRSGGDRRGPSPGRRGPGQPVRRGARLAPSRRDRSPAAPARGGRLCRARRRGRGALPRARRGHAPDPARRDDPAVAVTAARALRALVADGRIRELVIRKVDGEDVAASPFRPVLLEAGFVAGYRGLVLRPARRSGS